MATRGAIGGQCVWISVFVPLEGVNPAQFSRVRISADARLMCTGDPSLRLKNGYVQDDAQVRKGLSKVRIAARNRDWVAVGSRRCDFSGKMALGFRSSRRQL